MPCDDQRALWSTLPLDVSLFLQEPCTCSVNPRPNGSDVSGLVIVGRYPIEDLTLQLTLVCFLDRFFIGKKLSDTKIL